MSKKGQKDSIRYLEIIGEKDYLTNPVHSQCDANVLLKSRQCAILQMLSHVMFLVVDQSFPRKCCDV